MVLVGSEAGLFGAEGWGALLLCFITEADFMEEVKSERSKWDGKWEAERERLPGLPMRKTAEIETFKHAMCAHVLPQSQGKLVIL